MKILRPINDTRSNETRCCHIYILDSQGEWKSTKRIRITEVAMAPFPHVKPSRLDVATPKIWQKGSPSAPPWNQRGPHNGQVASDKRFWTFPTQL